MKSDRSKTCGVIRGSIQNIATRFRAAQGDNFGDTWETHCNNIRQVLCRLQQSSLSLSNLLNVRFSCLKLSILSMWLMEELQAFLDSTNYYCKFKKFCRYTAPVNWPNQRLYDQGWENRPNVDAGGIACITQVMYSIVWWYCVKSPRLFPSIVSITVARHPMGDFPIGRWQWKP